MAYTYNAEAAGAQYNNLVARGKRIVPPRQYTLGAPQFYNYPGRGPMANLNLTGYGVSATGGAISGIGRGFNAAFDLGSKSFLLHFGPIVFQASINSTAILQAAATEAYASAKLAAYAKYAVEVAQNMAPVDQGSYRDSINVEYVQPSKALRQGLFQGIVSMWTGGNVLSSVLAGVAGTTQNVPAMVSADSAATLIEFGTGPRQQYSTDPDRDVGEMPTYAIFRRVAAQISPHWTAAQLISATIPIPVPIGKVL